MNTKRPLIYRGAEVDAILGTGKSTRFNRQNPKCAQFDPTWPLPIKLSTRSTGYIVAEVEAWLASRPRARIISNEGAE